MQLLANGIVQAAIIVLVGVGFALTYRVARFFHFAHAAVFTCSAYAVFFLKTAVGVPLPCAIILGVGVGSVLGCLMEVCVYLPLKRRGSSPSE